MAVILIFQIAKCLNALIYGDVDTMVNEVIWHLNQNKADNTEFLLRRCLLRRLLADKTGSFISEYRQRMKERSHFHGVLIVESKDRAEWCQTEHFMLKDVTPM